MQKVISIGKQNFVSLRENDTSACASGTHAIGAAYTEIVMGRCDACISGGVEATVTPMGISGFTALKALSTALLIH